MKRSRNINTYLFIPTYGTNVARKNQYLLVYYAT